MPVISYLIVGFIYLCPHPRSKLSQRFRERNTFGRKHADIFNNKYITRRLALEEIIENEQSKSHVVLNAIFAAAAKWNL